MGELTQIIVVSSTFPRWQDDTQPSFVLDLCQRLQSEFRITVIAPHAVGAAERETLNGLEVIRYRYASDGRENLCYGSGMFSNLRERPWNLAMLPRFFKAQAKALTDQLSILKGPVVVHAHWLFPQGWVAAKALSKASTPLLVTAHGSDVMKLKGPFWDRMHKTTLSRVQAVTSVGPDVTDRLRNELAVEEDRLFLLPLGVDTQFFVPSLFKRDGDHLLFVGRLVPEKGLTILLKALSVIVKKRPLVRLTVAGDGVERDGLKSLAETLGVSANVNFVGWCNKDALLNLYQTATLCVSPSVREGFGLVLAEALACGCPVIGSDLPAFRYLDGGSGAVALSGAKQPRDWAEQILSLLANPDALHDMSMAGRSRLEDISAAVQAKSYAEILRRLAESAVGRTQ